MSGLLAEIVRRKRADLANLKRERSAAALDRAALAAPAPRGFATALHRVRAEGRFGLIAEIKRASPSGGLIRPDFDPAGLARAYAEAGAACLSVLTDTPYFEGQSSHLVTARQACDLPILRKDFVVDPYQVAEARAIGADCILLIMAILGDAQAAELEAAARGYGLDVLVEVHDAAELDRALRLSTPLLGINNRNLDTLATGLDTSLRLVRDLPPDRLAVSESGLKTHADLDLLSRAGIGCFLVGESLLREADVGAATRRLLTGQGVTGLSHLDAGGRAVMVDVSGKPETSRVAVARGLVVMRPETLALVDAGAAPKGDVLAVARLAGIMAAKRTADLIPLCHPLALASVQVVLTLRPDRTAIAIEATVKTQGRTGVEMEALTAVSVAALTLYDMLKAVDRGMTIGEIGLVHKSGGKSGAWHVAPDLPPDLAPDSA